MLIKFNIDKVLFNYNNSVKRFIELIPKYPGQSFLLDYSELYKNYKSYNQIDIINYVILAAYRDYKYCSSHDDYTLPLDMSPISLKQLDLNRLIWYKDNKIFFVYEEDKARTLRKRK